MHRPSKIPSAPTLPPDASPARAALVDAERRNAEAGHEVFGALSTTHGFLPRSTPAQRLDAAAAELDDVASELPNLFATVALRRRLDRLGPVDVDAIPDALLQRASTVLGLLAHAYWHSDVRPPRALPPTLERAWDAVSERLGRPETRLSYNDGIVNNFRIPGVDGAYTPGGRRATELRLLVPTIDNDEERIFYLTQVVVLMDSATLVEASVRLQEAVLADDRASVKALLAYVSDVTRYASDVSLMGLDPNPATDAYVDPTIWTQTVANTFLPIRRGIPGASGTSSPVVHLLDALIGRRAYGASQISVEAMEIRHRFPESWRRVLEALEETRLVEWARAQQDPELDGLLGEAFLSFTGESGFLGRHRLKAYGYLDTAFKLGRDVTIGGFSQLLVDRTWDHVYDHLGRSRDERLEHIAHLPLSHAVRIVRAESATESDGSAVMRIRLDLAGAGVRYRPGDRLAVLPTNDGRLVRRTLGALGLDGDEEVALDEAWRAALRHRPPFREAGAPAALRLRELLRYARLRPASRDQAWMIYEMAPSEAVTAMVDNHLENDVELWDLLTLARRTHPGFEEALRSARDAGALVRLLPPEGFRLYSVASAPGTADGAPVERVDLVVARWRYETRDAVIPTTAALAPTMRPVEREGTASSFLVRQAQDGDARARELFRRFDVNGDGALSRDEVGARLREDGVDRAQVEELFSLADRDESDSIDLQEFTETMARHWLEAEPESPTVAVRIVPPSRFSVPDDPSAPVVMFAGGTGISPFRSFWQERSTRPESTNLLYFATRGESELYLQSELEELERAGKLRTRVAFSRGDVRARFEDGRFVLEPGDPERIDEVLEDEREAALLYRLLLSKEHGGLGGHFYVCGRSGFANTVLQSLTRIVGRFHAGVTGLREPAAEDVIRKLVADRRLCLEIFTTHRGAAELEETYRPSEIVLHNRPARGYWIVVDGRVLDMTEFRLLHPGGPQIIDNYAGTDASKAFTAIGHESSSEVRAMTHMYEIGRVERIVLPSNPMARLPDGEVVDLEETMKEWLRMLYAVTECENLLMNEYSAQDKIIRGGTRADEPCAYRIMLAALAQERMELRYLPALLGERLTRLWRSTLAFVERAARDFDDVPAALAAIHDSAAGRRRRDLPERLYRALDDLGPDPAGSDHAALRAVTDALRERNHDFLHELKLLVRRGVQRLERVDAVSLASALPGLSRTLGEVPALLEVHTDETLGAVEGSGIAPP